MTARKTPAATRTSVSEATAAIQLISINDGDTDVSMERTAGAQTNPATTTTNNNNNTNIGAVTSHPSNGENTSSHQQISAPTVAPYEITAPATRPGWYLTTSSAFSKENAYEVERNLHRECCSCPWWGHAKAFADPAGGWRIEVLVTSEDQQKKLATIPYRIRPQNNNNNIEIIFEATSRSIIFWADECRFRIITPITITADELTAALKAVLPCEQHATIKHVDPYNRNTGKAYITAYAPHPTSITAILALGFVRIRGRLVSLMRFENPVKHKQATYQLLLQCEDSLPQIHIIDHALCHANLPARPVFWTRRKFFIIVGFPFCTNDWATPQPFTIAGSKFSWAKRSAHLCVDCGPIEPGRSCNCGQVRTQKRTRPFELEIQDNQSTINYASSPILNASHTPTLALTAPPRPYQNSNKMFFHFVAGLKEILGELISEQLNTTNPAANQYSADTAVRRQSNSSTRESFSSLVSQPTQPQQSPDRKSTRLNSSHPSISRMPSSA